MCIEHIYMAVIIDYRSNQPAYKTVYFRHDSLIMPSLKMTYGPFKQGQVVTSPGVIRLYNDEKLIIRIEWKKIAFQIFEQPVRL